MSILNAPLSTKVAAAMISVVMVCGVSLLVLGVACAGRVYPGVKVSGVAVGGMTRTQAHDAVAKQAAQYTQQEIPITYSGTILRLPIRTLGVSYGDEGIDEALQYGRTGGMWQQLHAGLRALFARPTMVEGANYDDAKLTPYINEVANDVSKPVANASLNFGSGSVGVNPATPGVRLDIGTLVLSLRHQLAIMGTGTVAAPIYNTAPAISDASLAAAKSQADTYVAAPLALSAAGKTTTVDIPTIVSWVEVNQSGGKPTDLRLGDLQAFYHVDAPVGVALGISQPKVGAFVAAYAKTVDQEGRNAALTIQDGKATVFQPSRKGIQLDQPAAVQAIVTGVAQAPGARTLTLATKTIKPTVNEEDLNNLGINELLSEGQTYFPGSTSSRMQNIRVGSAIFNGVLLAPDEVFSFGKILGDVGPEQGYVPELVILANHEEKQYGGGLCQVASTAYRAALLAGLPIVERHNHSFAVSYYTAPFGVPGVDATIYYPQVDLKFRNDTGHYILIQTIMQGTTLTFDFYGTKTKTGSLRGPQFISGTTDSTKASHTVFWRDVLDLAGNVTKTDTIETYYEPSTNFPIQKQFN